MPIVTISRGTLSGGRVVAECLANRLGCPCIAREILQDAAKALGASADQLQRGFESPPGLWPRLTEQQRTYHAAVQAALADACIAGDLVYHGLAGQFLLRGVPGVLRVRLIAPLDLRVRALIRSHHRMSHSAAERFIRRVDRDRVRWVRLMYGADVDEPFLYDLTVNLEGLTIETACEIIATVASQPPYRRSDETVKQLTLLARHCQSRLPAGQDALG